MFKKGGVRSEGMEGRLKKKKEGEVWNLYRI